MHVRKGDKVVVIAGKEKGKRGKVLRVLTEKDRVVVEGVSMVKRHTKPTQSSPQGGIIEKEGTIELSNVAAVVRQVRDAAPRREASRPKTARRSAASARSAARFSRRDVRD